MSFKSEFRCRITNVFKGLNKQNSVIIFFGTNKILILSCSSKIESQNQDSDQYIHSNLFLLEKFGNFENGISLNVFQFYFRKLFDSFYVFFSLLQHFIDTALIICHDRLPGFLQLLVWFHVIHVLKLKNFPCLFWY